jgi:hypothetical protein
MAADKYVIQIKELQNIEDSTDEFMTHDELCDVLGYSEDDYHRTTRIYGCTHLREDLIKTELAAVIASIPEGKKSAIIKDQQLIDALVGTASEVSKFIPNTRRVGNRLTVMKARELKAKKSHATALGYIAGCILNDGFTVEFRYVSDNVAGAVAVIKKLITWEQIEAYLNRDAANRYVSYTEEDKKFMKEVWDNPNMFDKPVA